MITDELLVLGSSSGLPTARRFPTALVLKATGKLFLIDCGAPVSTLLYRYGLDPLEVTAIFLSHWHMDHVANLGMFLMQNHQLRRSRPLKVYGPRGTRGKIERLLADSFKLKEELSYPLKVTNVKTDKKYKEALVQVTFFKTQHLEKPAHKTNFGRKATSLGMVVQVPGWRAVYSGDLDSPQELSPYVKGCDLLIHEMAHVQPEAVAEFAEAAKIPHVLINHIGPDYDERPEQIAAAFNSRYSGDLIVAEDGTKVQLSHIRKEDKIEIKPLKPTARVSTPFSSPIFQSQDSAETTFLTVLQQEFALPEAASYRVLQAAQSLLPAQQLPQRPSLIEGQIEIEAARLPATPDDPAPITSRVRVIVTLDAGEADSQVETTQGAAGLRRCRLLRIQQEAVDQGGMLTQVELARLLDVSVRTIRRDLHTLKRDGNQIQTRGQLTN